MHKPELADTNQSSTERQQEAEALSSEALFYSMIEGLAEGVIIADLEEVALYCNARLSEMTGYTKEEIIGNRCYDLVATPAQGQEMLRRGEQRKQGLGDRFEMLLHKKDSTPIWMEIHVNPYRNAAGEVIGTLSACSDITGRKQVEAALHKLNEELQERVQERTAQLEASNHLLSERDRLLSATASAANVLLTVENLDEAVNTALQIIGESLDTDRVAVFENFTHPSDQSSIYWKALYEWNSLHTVPQISHPEAKTGNYKEIKEWYTLLSRGQGISYLLEDMPEPFRSGQESIGVKATHIVPIFVETKFWGLVGFDDCCEAKQRSDAELAILKIVADCIGSAIQRDRIHRAREAAELMVLLEREKATSERAAELAKANEALKRSLDILATDPDLNRFIGHVLKVAAECLDSFLTEYWWHEPEPSTVVYIGLTYFQGQILTPKEQPGHPGLRGLTIRAENIHYENLHHRKRHFVREDILTDPFFDDYTAESRVDVREWYLARGIRKELNIPLSIGERCIGGLCVYLPVDRHITEQQIELGYALAQQVTLAIQLTRLAEEAKFAAIAKEREKAASERAAELAKANDALKQTLAALAAEQDLDKFLIHVLRAIIQQSEAWSAHLFSYDEAENTLTLRLVVKGDNIYFGPAPGDPPLFHSPFDADITPAWRHLLTTRNLIFRSVDAQDDKMVWEESKAWHIAQGHSAHAGIALIVGERAVGMLGIAWKHKSSLKAEQAELVQALANQATLAMQLTRLAEQAKQEAQQAAVMKERNRMACEFHDTLAQTLTGIVVHQEAAKSSLTLEEPTTQQSEAQQHITRTLALARDGLAEARRSVWALRPGALEHADICDAFRALIRRIAADTNLQTECRIQGTPFTLPLEVEGNLLRIGQEAITNVLKHAGANLLSVRLVFAPDSLQLVVQDDGQGFESAQQTASGFGLVSMSERARSIGAHLSVTSTAGQGTEVKVVVLLSQTNNQLTMSSQPNANEQLTRILIADDHPVVREGVAALLEREPDLTVIAQASNGKEAVELFRIHQPDIGLIDLRMPQMGGVEAIIAILAEEPDACLVVLTTYDSDEDIYRGLRAGAKGYLLKDAPREQLLECIRSVHQGQSYIPSEVGAKLVERMNSPQLSERERDVLCLMALGKSNQEIGTDLGITLGTVKSHVNKLLHKLQVTDRTQAVLMALKRGIANL